MEIVPNGRGQWNVMYKGRLEAGPFNHFQAAQAWVNDNIDDWPPNWSKWKSPAKSTK